MLGKVRRVGEFYARQFEFIRRMRKHLRVAFLVFLLTTAAGAIFFMLMPSLAVRWLAHFKAAYLQSHPRLLSQTALFFHIALNNLRLSLVECLAGLVPFFVPALIILVVNATLLCLIFAVGLIQHQPILTRFLTLVLPHGLIEIPTMIFVAGFSLYLSSQMTKRFLRGRPQLSARTAELFGFMPQNDLPDRQEAFVDILSMYASVIVPLVLIAAVIETFITPFVHRIFG